MPVVAVKLIVVFIVAVVVVVVEVLVVAMANYVTIGVLLDAISPKPEKTRKK